VARAHVIAWRQQLVERDLADATIRRKLSTIAALFDYLAQNNAIADNPVHGVKRPMAISREGASPALNLNVFFRFSLVDWCELACREWPCV